MEYPDGSVLHVIDVDAEEELRAKYGFEVPVVEVEGGRTFALAVDAREFAAAIGPREEALRV